LMDSSRPQSPATQSIPAAPCIGLTHLSCPHIRKPRHIIFFQDQNPNNRAFRALLLGETIRHACRSALRPRRFGRGRCSGRANNYVFRRVTWMTVRESCALWMLLRKESGVQTSQLTSSIDFLDDGLRRRADPVRQNRPYNALRQRRLRESLRRRKLSRPDLLMGIPPLNLSGERRGVTFSIVGRKPAISSCASQHRSDDTSAPAFLCKLRQFHNTGLGGGRRSQLPSSLF